VVLSGYQATSTNTYFTFTAFPPAAPGFTLEANP